MSLEDKIIENHRTRWDMPICVVAFSLNIYHILASKNEINERVPSDNFIIWFQFRGFYFAKMLKNGFKQRGVFHRTVTKLAVIII